MSSELRQRKPGAKNSDGTGTEGVESTISKRAREEREERELNAATEEAMRKRRTSVIGRALLFVGLPSFVGFCGMLVGYLVAEEKEMIDFDRDFVFPFLLTLVLVIVIGFQTKGFTQDKPKPFLAWPKVKRKRNVVHRRVIVDDNADEKEGAAAATADEPEGTERRQRRGTRKED